MISFKTLRRANLLRLPMFRDRQGRVCHTETDGSDWKPADWMTAVVGEVGELANLLKKVKRGDMTQEEAHEEIGHELADIQGYLDILAFQLGHDLGRATSDKFNIVSRRVGADVFIDQYCDSVVRRDPRAAS